MQLNNIENQIKEKFNAREIQPSAQSWDRLDAMLTVAEEKKPKSFLFFLTSRNLGIAASFLVFLSVGLFFFNQENNSSIPNNEVIVETEVQKPADKLEQMIKEDNPVATTGNKSTITNHQSSINSKQLITNNQQSAINNHGVSIINQKTNQNPIINRKKEIEFLGNGDVALKDLPKIISAETKIIQPKTQVIQQKASYINVDALLASAESPNKTTVKSDKIKVDANTLLSHADSEVETTFREKVLNGFTKSYKEVKSALATRNLE